MKVKVENISYSIYQHQQNRTLPSLLLLHGFMGGGQVFAHLIKQLSEFCNPITIDLLGHGSTEGTSSSERYKPEYQLNDLHSIIKELETTNLFLHGYSMGGRLALRFALRYPNLISGLILESSNYGIEDPQQKEDRIQVDEQRAKAIEQDFDRFLNEWQKLPLFKNDINVPEELRFQYDEVQRRQNPAYLASSLRGFGTAAMPSVKEELEQLTIPVLLLAGELDKKYRQILGEMESKISSCRFHIIKDAGHRIHLENPQAFLDHLKAFVLCSSGNR